MTSGNWRECEYFLLVTGNFAGSLGAKRAGGKRVAASGRRAGSPPHICSVLSQGTGQVAWSRQEMRESLGVGDAVT